MFTLIIGGSASGKSEHAERHALSLGGRKIYLAAMEPFGEEAQARIARHHKMRLGRGFETVECYTGLEEATVPLGSNVLLEDLGNLLANEMFSPQGILSGSRNGSRTSKPEDGISAASEAVIAGVEALLGRCAHLTVVTNEVFSGGNAYAQDTLRYLRELACVNRRLAERADLVVEVVCGVPDILKDASAMNDPRTVRLQAQKPYFSFAAVQSDYYAGRGDRMIFVTGPLFAGKQEAIKKILGWSEAEFQEYAVRDVQDLAAEAARRQYGEALPQNSRKSLQYVREKEMQREEDDPCLEGFFQQKDASRQEQDALRQLADALALKKVVIATEVGGGVVPVDPGQRREREAAGRLACLLAARADVVIRVCCGIPQILKR